MKRILFASVSAAALFAGAPALAQTVNSSTVRQGGTSNTTTVNQQRTTGTDTSLVEQNQSGGGSNNKITVKQFGDSAPATNSESRVFQAGSNDTAKVTQKTTMYATGVKNLSTISQAGTDSSGSTADVEQYGHNESRVTQTNGANKGTIKQGALEMRVVGGNLQTLKQDGDDEATVEQNVDAKVPAEGNYGGNTAYTEQGAGSNTATIKQSGLSATANTLQTGGGDVKVTQNGDNQVSNVNQLDDGTVEVEQGGNANDSFVRQASTSSAKVTQSGDTNQSSVIQREASNGSSATVTQTGDKNYASTLQRATGTTAGITQMGNQNDAYVNQSGAGANVRIGQTESNPSGESQPRYRGFDGRDVTTGGDKVRANFARVTQKAAGDKTEIDQNGFLNRASVVQSGGGSVKIDQQKLFNNADVNQAADAKIDIKQLGAYGDSSAIVTQTAGAGGASATVTQYGDSTKPTDFPSNEAAIAQSANAQTTVEQHGQQNYSYSEQLAGADGAVLSVKQTNYVGGEETDRNKSYVSQSAMTAADVEQIGQRNSSSVIQTAMSTAPSYFKPGNLSNAFGAKVYQNGIGNDSTLSQTGNESYATVSQNGNGNISDVNQSAKESYVEVAQNGVGNTSYVIQSGGDHNQTVVNQQNNNNYSSVTQSGSENTATVYQGSVMSGGGM